MFTESCRVSLFLMIVPLVPRSLERFNVFLSSIVYLFLEYPSKNKDKSFFRAGKRKKWVKIYCTSVFKYIIFPAWEVFFFLSLYKVIFRLTYAILIFYIYFESFILLDLSALYSFILAKGLPFPILDIKVTFLA